MTVFLRSGPRVGPARTGTLVLNGRSTQGRADRPRSDRPDRDRRAGPAAPDDVIGPRSHLGSPWRRRSRSPAWTATVTIPGLDPLRLARRTGTSSRRRMPASAIGIGLAPPLRLMHASQQRHRINAATPRRPTEQYTLCGPMHGQHRTRGDVRHARARTTAPPRSAAIARLRDRVGRAAHACIPFSRHDREAVADAHRPAAPTEHEREHRREPDAEAATAIPNAPSTIQTGSVRCGHPCGPTPAARRSSPGPSTRSAARSPSGPPPKCSASGASATMPMPMPTHEHEPGDRPAAGAPVAPEVTRCPAVIPGVLLVLGAALLLEATVHRDRRATATRRTTPRSIAEHPRRRRPARQQQAADHRAERDARVHAQRRPGCSPTRCPPASRPGSGSPPRGREERQLLRSPRRTPARSGAASATNAIAMKNTAAIASDQIITLRRSQRSPEMHPRTADRSRDPERQQQRQRLHDGECVRSHDRERSSARERGGASGHGRSGGRGPGVGRWIEVSGS